MKGDIVMKKRAGIVGLAIVLALSMLGMTGCGEKMPYSDLNLDDYLEVKEYKGVKAEAISVSVAPTEIGDEIVAALEAAAEQKELKKGTAVEEGDVLNLDYVGKIDGKAFDGGSAEGASLELGSGSYIDGFESGLIGKTVGQKGIKLNLTFPEDYNSEELQGKDVVFTVKINSATRLVQPEYNLDFVKTQGDYKSIEEYEADVKKRILKSKKEEALGEQKISIWSDVLESTKMKKYPEDMVKHYKTAFSEQIDYYAEQNGMERKAVMSQYYGASSEEDLDLMLDDYAKTLVKQEMLVEYIAGKEGLTYTDEETEKLKKDIEEQGYDEDTVLRETGRTMEQYLHIELLYEKVLNFLVKEADIK